MMVLTQGGAMLLDAYRELNAKKMFWITLALSAFVVLAIACVGINDKGVSVLWWTFPLGVFNSSIVSPAFFYKFVFINFGFKFWLTWAATILALISTASLIPDFVTGGSIDLVLSKPIGRLRLFLTKYTMGLLFVGLQVSVFSAASFLVIGVRGGAWEWKIFLAVPLVLLFFSFLYCVCALIGLLTRSTIAALLLTILFWFVIFMVDTAEQSLLLFQLNAEDRVASIEKKAAPLAESIAKQQAAIAQLKEEPAGESAEDKAKREAQIITMQASLSGFELRQQSSTSSLKDYQNSELLLSRWHTAVFSLKTILPKTSETMGILERSLTSLDEVAKLEDAQEERREERRTRRSGATPPSDGERAQGRNGPDDFSSAVTRKQQEIIRSRSVWWILGTSLGFEAVVLGIACLIFSRRDF
ncbi:MAG: ABC transporter permease [Phycisphaeraceae bacterium]|nr:ABC transporter permease [Phycisphaeraceae bacterium]